MQEDVPRALPDTEAPDDRDMQENVGRQRSKMTRVVRMPCSSLPTIPITSDRHAMSINAFAGTFLELTLASMWGRQRSRAMLKISRDEVNWEAWNSRRPPRAPMSM